MPRSLVPCLLMMCLPTAGCLVGRVADLERQLDTLQRHVAQEQTDLPSVEDRLSSTGVAIDITRKRVDAIVPADAQWMNLEEGSVLKWYLSPVADTVYIQFQEVDRRAGTVEIKVLTSTSPHNLRLHPGESFSWKDTRGEWQITVSLHQIRYREGEVGRGLLSVSVGQAS